jgi:hypothetical protein
VERKQTDNLEDCGCTSLSCGRRGLCCDCLRNHLKARQLPGCVFSPDAERTYDRSFEHFARLVQKKQV